MEIRHGIDEGDDSMTSAATGWPNGMSATAVLKSIIEKES